METAVGIVIGIVGSLLITRYYHQRTVAKELSIFELLRSTVFAGIAPDVRDQLHFHFGDREVTELEQLMFVVANTGQRAIQHQIEPLTLPVGPAAVVLDASIVHRQPEKLQASLEIIEVGSPTETSIKLHFPLLNKGEFFVVKLLLSGSLPSAPLTLDLLCEDLPRTISSSRLPSNAYDPYKFEWPLAGLGLGLLTIPAWISYALYLLRDLHPTLFPYPWASYAPSFTSFGILVPALLFIAGFTLLGLTIFGAAVFGGEFPPRKGPRFPLPKAVRDAVYSGPMWRLHPEFGETPKPTAGGAVAGGEIRR